METHAPGQFAGRRPEQIVPVVALGLGLTLSVLFGGYVHHDTLPILTRVAFSPAWLQDANGYPLECALLVLVRALPGDPRLWWNLLGCVHLGVLGWLLARICRCVFSERPGLAWVAPLLALVNPYTLQLFLGLNSVAQLTLCLLLWTERTLAGSVCGRRAALALLALARLDGLVYAFLLAAVASSPAIRVRRGGIVQEFIPPLVVVLVYPLLWKLLFGDWLGLHASLSSFEEIMGFVAMGPVQTVRWLRWAWAETAGNVYLIGATVGAVVLFLRRRDIAALLGPPCAIHLLLAACAMAGRVVDIRYLAPVLPYAAIWFVVMIGWVVERFRRPASTGTVIAAIFCAVALVSSTSKLGYLKRVFISVYANAGAVARCYREQVQHGPVILVVPGSLRGEVIYALARESQISEVLFEKAYEFDRARYAGLPTLWFATGPFTDRAAATGKPVACPGFSGAGVFALNSES